MEVWKDCVDYPDLFEVSNLGSFRNKRNKRLLKQFTHPHGYLHVSTKVGGRKGKCVTFKVHREVAKAFLDNPESLPCVNHKDGVKSNNQVENLEWISFSGNTRHAITLGLMKIPVRPFILTEEQRKFVQQNYRPKDRNFGARALGKKFNVNHTTILRTIYGR